MSLTSVAQIGEHISPTALSSFSTTNKQERSGNIHRLKFVNCETHVQILTINNHRLSKDRQSRRLITPFLLNDNELSRGVGAVAVLAAILFCAAMHLSPLFTRFIIYFYITVCHIVHNELSEKVIYLCYWQTKSFKNIQIWCCGRITHI